MKNIKLKKGYEFNGYSIYLPDEILVIYSCSTEPIEKGASFGFMWQAEVDGVVHEDTRLAYSDNPFLTETEKKEMFDLLERDAIRKLDELLAHKHKDL